MQCFDARDASGQKNEDKPEPLSSTCKMLHCGIRRAKHHENMNAMLPED